jgi:hypothetical protein
VIGKLARGGPPLPQSALGLDLQSLFPNAKFQELAKTIKDFWMGVCRQTRPSRWGQIELNPRELKSYMYPCSISLCPSQDAEGSRGEGKNKGSYRACKPAMMPGQAPKPPAPKLSPLPIQSYAEIKFSRNVKLPKATCDLSCDLLMNLDTPKEKLLLRHVMMSISDLVSLPHS